MNILDPSFVANFYKNHFEFFIVGLLAGAFLLTYYLIPKIIYVVKEKKLLKPVNGRSSHTKATPSMGGVAFFVTFVLAMAMLQTVTNQVVGAYLIAATTILFMVGIKDDLVVSSPRVKFVGQLLATAFIVFAPALQIDNLHGFLGINEIPALVGYLAAAFIVVALVNTYNLIDGINGLAGMVGIIIALSYAVVFYLTQEYFYVLVAVTIIGILLAFLRFNLAGEYNRIFMGDSGSLIIGLILAFLTLKILAMPTNLIQGESSHFLHYRWLFVIAVLFIPIFDVSRVMTYRFLTGKNVFSADRNHSHHILLDKGCSHMAASLILAGMNVLSIGLLALIFAVFPQTPFLFYALVLLLYIVCWFCFYQLKRSIPQIPKGQSSPHYEEARSSTA